jgi:hypothetical protein
MKGKLRLLRRFCGSQLATGAINLAATGIAHCDWNTIRLENSYKLGLIFAT